MNLDNTSVFTSTGCSSLVTGLTVITFPADARFILQFDIGIFIFLTAIDGGYNIRFSDVISPNFNVTNNTIEYINVGDMASANYFFDDSTEICGSEVIPESIMNVRIIGKTDIPSRFPLGVVYFIRIGRRVSDNSIVGSATLTRTRRPPFSNALIDDDFTVSKCSTIYRNINTALITPDNYIGDNLEIRLKPLTTIIYHPDTQNYEFQMQDASFFIKGSLVDYQTSGTIISVSTENITPTVICDQTVTSDLRTINVIITESARVLKTGDVYTIQVGRRISDSQLVASIMIARTRRPGFTN